MSDLTSGLLEPASSRLLTVTETMQVLNVSKWTIYQLMYKKELIGLKIGSRRLIPVASIDAYVARLTEQAKYE